MSFLYKTFTKNLSWRLMARILSSFTHQPSSIDFDSFIKTEEFLISSFSSCSTMRDLTLIHSQIIKFGFTQHVFVIAPLISFCSVSSHGSMDYALSVFGSLKWPDGFLFNTMIRGFGRENRVVEAISFYKRMREKEKEADNFTFCFLIKLCGRLMEIPLGKQIHCCVFKHGFGSNNFVSNTLIHMYGVFKEMISARKAFDEMTERNLVSWNTMIDCYVSCGDYKEALRLFIRMIIFGLTPDETTLVVILSACSELKALEFGRSIHFNIINNPLLNRTISVSNSLIDFYAKCGEIHKANQLFDQMPERNIVSYNTIILGLALHGHTKKALNLFNNLIKSNKIEDQPDEITFLGTLCACTHSGLINEGKKYFEIMQKEYGLSPNIRHYGCMVDLLGKAGLVKEAYDLIKNMPIEGNSVIWRTLLGACRIHGEVELGEIVLQNLNKIGGNYHSSDFVLISHVYAGANRWNDVLEVRENMRGKMVKKPEPGNSLFRSVNSIIGSESI